MNKRRKVTFLDPISDRDPIERCDAPSSRTERVQSFNVDDVKTSEFKSFKRLLGETGRKLHTNQGSTHANNLRRAKNNEVTCTSDATESLFPVQKVTPIAQRPSSSSISHNSDLDDGRKYGHNASSFLTPIQKVTSNCWKSSFSPEKLSLNSGSKPEFEGTFLAKRKKLLQLVAEASSRNVDEILSNKSDLILEFLERLGAGQKSVNLGEPRKPGQKISTGRYPSPASLKASSNDKESQGATSEETQGWIPVGHVQDHAFPACHALEAGAECHGWQLTPSSDGKSKSNLYAQDTSISTPGLYQVADNWLPKGNQLSIFPRDYSIIHAFPASDVLHSSLQSIHLHPNPTFDGEGIENKSASRKDWAMEQMQPKVHEFVSSPCGHTDLQVSPARQSLDAGTEGRRWCSNSVSKEVTSGSHRLFRADDEVCTFPGIVMLQSLPATHAVQTGCQDNYYSTALIGGMSELHTDKRLMSGVGLGMEFEYDDRGCYSEGKRLSKSRYWVPEDFPIIGQFKDRSEDFPIIGQFKDRSEDFPIIGQFKDRSKDFPIIGQFKNRSIVPYIDASSSAVSSKDLYSDLAEEPFLLPWSSNIDAESSIHSTGEHRMGLDYLPLTLYHTPNTPDRTADCHDINPSTKRNFFSLPRPGIKLKWNRFPLDFDKENCQSICTKLPLDKEQGDCGFSLNTAKNICWGDEKDFLEIPSHLPADLSSLGLEFSMDREESIFGLPSE